MTISEAYRALYTVALIILAILIGIMLIRAVKGPRVTDRILSVNMIGTMVISSILILSQMLGENYLIDVALIYAMISFLSVIILAAVYIPSRKKREDS
ncbi:monovalent cation/H+ antiporter complex subunit F [Lachnospiraceae bacterium C1.1]|nr:monovalent cation/H+ antiporter complex subunit F [Lachnospiraceae bacterium C1.1]